jgi:hypothetical protein
MNLNIERSKKINGSRLKRMEERNKCIVQIKNEAKDNMLKTIVDPSKPQYKMAIKNILIQVTQLLYWGVVYKLCRE